jgi:hypothetical protein
MILSSNDPERSTISFSSKCAGVPLRYLSSGSNLSITPLVPFYEMKWWQARLAGDDREWTSASCQATANLTRPLIRHRKMKVFRN